VREVGQPWTATTFSLSQLREFGLDPSSDRARRTVELIGASSRWDEGGQPYWEGEVEACINGRTVADGAYFGVDVSPIVERLLTSVRRRRLELREVQRLGPLVVRQHDQRAGRAPGARESHRGHARIPGGAQVSEEYLLKRNLFRRLGTGEPADERFLDFLHPNRWHYDVLRALDYFRSSAMLTSTHPDPRLGEAIDHVRSGAWRTHVAPRPAPKGRCGSRSTTGRASPRGG
jgi:hypothetical protein